MKPLRGWMMGLTNRFSHWPRSPPCLARAPRAHVSKSCFLVLAGTVVQVDLANDVSTKVQKPGENFVLRLSAPLVVNGRWVVLRAGTLGVGQVVESARPGMGGKPGELVLAARYLKRRHIRVELQGMQLASAGHDNSRTAQIVGLAGFIATPLGYAGLAVKGGDVDFAPGTTATAKVAADIVLPSLGPAPPNDVTPTAVALRASVGSSALWVGSTVIPQPPPGQGQVIFFRKKSLVATGQWFRVREGDKAIRKLANGTYFVENTTPGTHTYSASFEPELKDKLTLQVDPGETYFVQGTTTVGLVIGAADLSPSDRSAFLKEARRLKSSSPAAHTLTAQDTGGADKSAGEAKSAAATPSGVDSVSVRRCNRRSFGIHSPGEMKIRCDAARRAFQLPCSLALPDAMSRRRRPPWRTRRRHSRECAMFLDQ